MQVSEIIRGKGARVVSVASTEPLERVSRVLRDASIGAAIVMDEDGRMAGILSERDIVHGVAGRGAEVLAEPVSKFMTREVQTCAPDASVDQLMDQMVKGHIRHLPVVDEGSLVGVISVGDVVKHGMAEMLAVRETLKRYIHDASVRALDDD